MKADKGWGKELFYQLVDNVKDYAIFLVDPEGTIVSWNAGAEKLFGYTRKRPSGGVITFYSLLKTGRFIHHRDFDRTLLWLAQVNCL